MRKPRSPQPAVKLDPDLLLGAYSIGIFPMGDSADDPEIVWIKPESRGIIPLDAFHVPRSLAKRMRSEAWDVRFNADFEGVLDGCAESKPGRETTWINHPIREAYRELHARGHCHSVEVYRADNLVGGLYGVSLGSAFFGESMFSRETDSSKVALVHLVERLKARGFTLLDTQFTTEHLKRFGAIDVPRLKYEDMLADALTRTASFDP